MLWHANGMDGANPGTGQGQTGSVSRDQHSAGAPNRTKILVDHGPATPRIAQFIIIHSQFVRDKTNIFLRGASLINTNNLETTGARQLARLHQNSSSGGVRLLLLVQKFLLSTKEDQRLLLMVFLPNDASCI